MTDFSYLKAQVAKDSGCKIRAHDGTHPDLLASCERQIGAAFPTSLRAIFLDTNGFELRDADGSFLQLYEVDHIVRRTLARRRRWSGTPCWGSFIEIAKSDESESAYAVRPAIGEDDDSPLFEIWPEGYDEWQTNSPLAPSLGAWVRAIGDAIATGDHDQVYARLWSGLSR